MAITYGVEYLAPETINPIFLPRAFTRAYLQEIDQTASTDAIQAELDAITEQLVPIIDVFGAVGTYANFGAGTTITSGPSNTTTTVAQFSIQAGNVAMVNYSLKMSTPTSSSSNVLTSFCVSVVDGTAGTSSNIHYNPRLTSQSGTWVNWYSNNSVVVKNTANSTHTYYLTTRATFTGFSTFTISGQNITTPLVQIVVLSTNA